MLVAMAGLLTETPTLTPVAPTDGVTLFLGRLPLAPDTCYSLKEYGGRPAAMTHDGTARRFQRFQVVTRDPDPLVAREMAQAVYTRYLRFTQRELGTPPVTYERVVPLADPFPLDNDEMARTVIACNYEVWFQHED